MIASMIVLIKRRNSNENPSLIERIILIIGIPFLVLTALLLIFAGYIRIHQIQLPSRVNVSPIAKITETQMGLLDDAIVQLEYYPLITQGRYTQGRYDLHWERSTVSWLRVNVNIFDDEADAVALMNRRRPERGLFVSNRRRFREVVNNNHTSAILEHCNNYFSVPRRGRANRYMRSFVQIGNVVFIIHEARPRNDRDNNYSSQFIALFVELLEEAELAHYDE